MNGIGKILPVEGYVALLKGNLPAEYAKSLTHLYQPLIGINSVMLYQTLLNEVELQQGTAQTHHTLMNYLNIPLDEIYRTRLKLEGIGLLKTYEEKTESHNVYTYELQCPFAPSDFFNDDMLSQLLYHHIGETKHKSLKNYFLKQPGSHPGKNITASFHDVFQTFQPYIDNTFINEADHVEMEEPEPAIDFSWIEQMLKQRMIPVKKVLTGSNKRLISQMMVLYDLAAYEIEKSILWALDDENILNINEFKDACHDLFKTKHNQPHIQLSDRVERPTETEADYKPTTKEEQLIYQLEKISPKQLLEDLSSGNHASEQDMKIIREVMTTQGLPSPVMNVLIHYILLQSNMKLSKAYMEKIASHWSRANLKSAKEAMAFAKKEQASFQKGASRRQNYRKPVSKEVIPEWFKEQEEKQKAAMNQKESAKKVDEAKETAEVAKLLEDFMNNNKSNHL